MRWSLLTLAAFAVIDFAVCFGVDGLLALTGSGPAPLWLLAPAVYGTAVWAAWRWDRLEPPHGGTRGSQATGPPAEASDGERESDGEIVDVVGAAASPPSSLEAESGNADLPPPSLAAGTTAVCRICNDSATNHASAPARADRRGHRSRDAATVCA
jgi:hypothetical protein